MKGETGLRPHDPAQDAGMIQDLSPLWRHFESVGYEPRLVTDLRPWIVVLHSALTVRNAECWLICTSTTCPTDVYALATKELPDTLVMEGCGNVNGYDYMVFCG